MDTKKVSMIAGICIGLVIAAFIVPNEAETVDILMKGAIPTKADAYLCTAYRVTDAIEFIYKFEALANASTVHHMLLYGCDGEPATNYYNWVCPAMCKKATGQSILFAWAKNAPATVLPKDVGFRIGSSTSIKTLVLQVHYAKLLSAADYSGIRIYTTKESPKNVAGIFFMVSNSFLIPKGKPAFPVDISCRYNQKNKMTIFAVRGHTHNLGVVVSSYINNGTSTKLIKKINPQWPQNFYPLEDYIEVQQGDSVFSRCTYNSTLANGPVGVGPAGEMCNCYLMYYTNSTVQETFFTCSGNMLTYLTGSHYPADGSVPLPPNPYLEEVAKGIAHNSSMSERSVRSVPSEPEDSKTKEILMKGAKPHQPDAYLCTGYSLDAEEEYIYKFEAVANADTAHHMLLYGCDGEAYSDQDVWACPPMCKNGNSVILFAWAKNAPPTVLPKDVGLKIGSKTSIKTLVLQVHYSRTFGDSEQPDHSGLKIYTTHKKQKFNAGIFLLMMGNFKVPPNEKTYPVDISCKFNMQASIFPFAYRAHAHALGKVITGYQYNGTYNVIGKGNPQWPQAFYPVHNYIEVKPGDYLAARCTYDSSSRTQTVYVGSTGSDEMCNFYIMFYTDSSVSDPSGECYSNEFPHLTGKNFPSDVSVPLPPNPDLEEIAKGGHHHAGMNQNHQDDDNGNTDSKTHDILMPGAKPTVSDAYLCTAYPVIEDESYIYKFEALANAATAHHILLFGCDGEPFSTEPIWHCPSECKNGQPTILFAWAKNAPPTVLPKGVGFRVGSKTSIKTIVMQVHYAKIFEDSEPADHSGLRLYTTFQKPQYVASVFLLAAGSFTIPPGSSSFPVDISCKFPMEKSIFPFAYRTHAHGLGKVITSYQYNGSYHEIGKGNPQWPQAFYPVKDFIEVKPGDSLAARCTYDSTSMSHSVGVGGTGNDEMCNFYIMYYTDISVTDLAGMCSQDALPYLTGKNFPQDVSVPLPPNPDLEEVAKGGHHHGGMNQNEISFPDSQTKDILMPGAKPSTPDAYLCTSYQVPDEEYYIYKFEALANAETAHHMLLYGCDGEPFSTDDIWNCPPMCKNGMSVIMFAWAKNAPPTVFPKGVGLRVGRRTSIKTIVLQVHYAKTFEDSEPADHSGLRIYTTFEKPQYVAGIFLLAGNGFSIPPGIASFPVDVSCKFPMEKSIFPFAYRTHAHGLGKVITGYQNNGTYHEIGKGNPQWPQAFYPVKDLIEVKPGDSLAARCTYDSTSMSHPVGVGSTGKDEMCNFYFMFYTDSSVANPSGVCGFNELTHLTGKNFPSDVSVPLPPNPDLEEVAKGGHHHGGMNQNEISFTDILMPGAKPSTHDAYLCTTYQVPEDEYYIYKFEALANAETAHHMLLYGCDGEPFSTDNIWNCPPMCKSGQSIIMFAWAKNAPPTVLPKGVGLRVGSKTSIKTIVLQVHYAKIFAATEPADHSGLRLYTTKEKPQYVAGIFLLASNWFQIPPGKESFPVDISCTFDKEKSIFPFAYRTHAHGLGKVITGYQHNGTYHEIGKGNPQWPQAFYPVKDVIEVKRGDSLAARCTYQSTSMSKTVKVGSTGNDEMCNFYVMFYTDSSVTNPYGECGSDELPRLTGNNFPSDVSVPLPPNPDLEEVAKGGHHHAGMSHQEGESAHYKDSETLNILMRGAKPKKPDAYLCTAYPAQDLDSYIYKFEAVADASTAHHMLLYGCDGEAYSTDPIWNCPAMCKRGRPIILFAWAKNAPPTVLPKDVGLRFGTRTVIKTLVLQVHYARVFTDDEPEDHSGLKIYITHSKLPYVAGIFFLGSSDFTVPSGKSSYPVDVSCRFLKEKSIFPFAYRTHAHALGRVITGYQYNNTYHEIGKGNPQWPQTFYPVKDKIEVKPSDYLLARCTYDSTSMTHSVNVGSTGNDEMCNFYIMFYTDSSVRDPYGECLRNAVPGLTGGNFPADVSVPLPPNPELEDEAKGIHHQHHGGMAGSEDDEPSFSDSQRLDLLMTGAKPDKLEEYMCTSYSVTDEEAYIYKVEAIADKTVVHHTMLYGCNGEPISKDMWHCTELCKGKEIPTILFAWTSTTSDPTVVLPKGVGLKIGSKTNIKFLVLQVHYNKTFSVFEEGDHSGFRIHLTHQKQPFSAGVFTMLRVNFDIPQKQPAYFVDISCRMNLTNTIYPFAFMTHSHKLGQVISGYQYNGSFNEIGRGNPHWPQQYYPVKKKIVIQPGDYMAARCTYNTMLLAHSTKSGSTGADEMCNFFILFYTDSSVVNPFTVCTDDKEPTVTGKNFPLSGSMPLPPNPEFDSWYSEHNTFLWESGPLQITAFSSKHRKKHFNTKVRPSYSVLQNKINNQKSFRHHHSGRSKKILELDYDVVDSSRIRRQAQEYYDEYAANDLREKGLYGPATSTEEGLSRNRNKEFEAINQELQHFPRKNAAGRLSQPQHFDQNFGKQQLEENINPASSYGQNYEYRKPFGSGRPANVGQGGDVPRPHSHIHLEQKLVFNATWPDEPIKFGQIGGVATDKNGNVYVFHRGSRTWTGQSFNLYNDFQYQDSPIAEDVIMILSSSGRLIKKFGAGQYFMPHGITVDQEGNIWLTDVALHQVFKIPAGKTQPSLTLGQRFQHSDDLNYFCKPTDVAVLSTGDFFISDGYCNSRVLKFSKDGTLVKAWGKRNIELDPNPPVGTFEIPHGITVSEEHQLVCVADRENGRIQCFDLDGNFKHVIQHHQFGPRLFALDYCPEHGGLLYAVNGPAFDGPLDFTVQGFTLDIKTGDLLEMWNVPNYMKNPHDVAVDPNSHSVYVGELDPQVVWKFTRASLTQSSTHGSQNVENPEESTQGHMSDSATKQIATLGSNATVLSGNAKDSSGISPSVIIGILLVIPVVLLLIIVLLVRAHQSGKLKCYGHGKKGKIFNLKGIIGNSHKGFDRLSTEESDHEVDPEDLDHTEYLAPHKAKNKA